MSCAEGALPSSAGEGGSAEEALTDDWLSCFDFSDLLSAPSTQGDQLELPELDCTGSFDFSCLLMAEENPPSFDLPEENPPFFDISESFSSMVKPHEADEAQDQCGQTLNFKVCTPPLQNDSSGVSSLNNSEEGSSVAVVEGVGLYSEVQDKHEKGPECHRHALKYSTGNSAASSGKRQREDIASDMEGGDEEGMEGGDEEGKLQHEPLDKKQQRLLRNRELAFESRQRKKCYVSDLEAKCKMLEQERNQLQQQVCFSAAENAVLKEEIARLKKMKGRDGVAEPAVLFEDSLPLEFLSLLICLHLLARLSLCVSPFLVLVIRAVVCSQSASEGDRLLKEQGDSERCSQFMIDDIRWSLDDHCFQRPFWVSRLVMAWLTWQVPSSSLISSFCKSLEG